MSSASRNKKFVLKKERRRKKSEIYFTIAGTKYRYEQKRFEPEMEANLLKEADKEFDDIYYEGKQNGPKRTADFTLFASYVEENEKTELEMSGLNPDELEFMKACERRKVLEQAGLNPDEYDF